MRPADAGSGTAYLSAHLPLIGSAASNRSSRPGPANRAVVRECATNLLLRLFPALIAAILLAGCVSSAHAQDSASGSSSTADANSSYQTAMSLAQESARNQDLAPELLAYLAAIQSEPSDPTAPADLFAMIAASGMPHVLTSEQIQAVAAIPGPFSIARVDRGVTLLLLDGSAGHCLDSLTDPQIGWPFPAIVDIYAPDPDGSSRSILVCAVHYQTTGDAALAEHVGRLLVLLRTVLTARSGHPPLFEGPFNVWMSRGDSTSPGGEQWRNNLYFYDIGDGRSSIEWIREIAHEYGHLALPPVGGNYTDPEAWANGYIGERLMVRWLTDPQTAGPQLVESVWGRTFSGYASFDAKLIRPALSAFLSTGLSKSALAETDAGGMRYVIGLLLWVDQTKGSKAVGDLLWNMSTPDPSVLFAPAKALGAPGPKLAARSGSRGNGG